MRTGARWLRGVALAGLAGLLVCVGAVAPAQAAEAQSKQAEVAATGSGLNALLSYREGLGGPLPYFDLKLRIANAALGIVYEAPVSSRSCGGGCEPGLVGGGPLSTSPLAIGDLEGNGQPDVVLELSTGGAHCCTVVQVFSLDPGVMAYRSVERDFGDPGALLSEISPGKLVFVSADDRFAYEFAPYAYSGLPLRVWSFQGGRFVDVTRSDPSALARDAARQFKGFLATRREGEGLGLIAAWAADEYLLGHRSLVSRTLAREARHGRLRSHERYAPSGRAFVAKLKRFLGHDGYA